MQYLNYEIKDYIANALNDLHFKDFSEVQRNVFDNLNKGRNLLVKSKTGSGKTHAFLIPIFNALDLSKKEVQAVIVSPTKELADQTYKVAQHIASFCDKEIKIKSYSGGQDRLKDLEDLEANQPQIVIGTPGRIKDLAVDKNALKIYTSKFYIIDEVDMVMSEGFTDDVDAITKIVPDARKMFFSATLNEILIPFVKKYLNGPIFIDLNNDHDLKIEHIWIPLKYRTKDEMLDHLLDIINPYLCIIFANKKGDVIRLYDHLKNDLGKEVAMIQGDLTQRERKHILKEAQDLKYQFIVASDLASRGIDIDGVSHVINYDLPNDYEFYLHRSGRTGRMNYSGTVYSFYKDLDNDYLDFLNKNGIEPIYKDIKGGQIVDFKGRNTRKKRVRPLTAEEKMALAHVSKPAKVTPGYKRKIKRQVAEITGKLYKTKNYKENYQRIRERKEAKKNRGR
jgi:ATP-dependent RNA helicase CshB